MMGWANHGYGMWGMGWFGSIMMLVFWVLIFVVLFNVIRSMMGSQRPANYPQGRDPREILKERFAKGEIEAQEYNEKMAILR
jgi:putative membrane protein